MMKPLCFALAVAAGISPALAQSAPRLGERPIARTEVIAAIKHQFAAMDSNHDGVVSQAEFQAYRTRQADSPDAPGAGAFGHVGSRWFERADGDGDGRVTLAEAEAHPLRLFDMADANRDGVVSVEEQKVALMMMKLGGK
jgi:hypothetical protein